MELDMAIEKRISVRAYLDKPVPRTLVEEILSMAVKAPSWGNTQPWELAVIGGKEKEELSAELADMVTKGETPNPDFEMPQTFSGAYMDRYRMTGKMLFELAGIGRDDSQARFNQFLSMFKGFDAPCLVYVLLDEVLQTSYPIFDAGGIANYISLLATSRGLGTCMMAALAMYPDPVRKKLSVPKNKKIAIGLSLGYPDTENPVNNLNTQREAIENITTWVGMA
ncbi:MAG: nitroreductase [Desulfobacterales bacterium]